MEHKLHLYTGDGKGKTTAAMGLALRAAGHDWPVVIAQFMKDGTSGELTALKRLPGVMLYAGQPVHGFTFSMSAEELARTRAEQTGQTADLTALITRVKPRLVVLDELAVALSLDLVTEDAARALLQASLACAETVVTGRSAPEWLHRLSDYVSMISAEKHPYNTEQLAAREGVEW